ncbi:MAG: nuclear transport factor 2 family protein [Lautropia sp.]
MKQTHGTLHATSGDAEDAFYAALARGDVNTLMALWADDEDVVCVHPGGARFVGVRAIRESYAHVLANGPLRIAVRDLRVQSGVMVAVHSLVEHIEIAAARRASRIVQVVTTNVYMKGPDGWRIVLHHASPGETTERQLSPPADRPSGRLH